MLRALPPWCLALALASLGCDDVLVVGYACEDGVRRCAEKVASDGSVEGGGSDGGRMDGSDDGQANDGGSKDGESNPNEDAAMDAQSDSPTDAGGFSPFIRNRSFELTSGSEGNIDDSSGTRIEPWSSCPNLFEPLGGLAAVETGGLLGTLSPTEGDTLLRFSYVVPARFSFLTQELESPWPAGETRAITVDVAGQSVFNELRLTIIGSGSECPESDMREMLASAEVPQTGMWTRDVCVEITPAQEVQWLILHAESDVPTIDVDGGAGITAQVFVDNLRESESCP